MPSTAVRFVVTTRERELVRKVVDRALHDLGPAAVGDRTSVTMDLIEVHANGCPLDFEKLLAADSFDFSHDVRGIVENLDRRTGDLRNLFFPLCAKPQEPTS